MEQHEVIIRDHGKYYVGTVSDYINIARIDGLGPIGLGLREATLEDLSQYKEKINKER